MPLPYETLPGDVDRLVADDHAVVERQFQFLEAGAGDRRVLADQVAFELVLHADAEERTLYPVMADAGEPDESERARAEHREVRELLVALGEAQPGEQEFEDALATLIATVRSHVAEEEREFLPRLRELVGPQRVAELGPQFLAAKRAAPRFPHPNAPTGRLGHLLADPAAVLVDQVRDLTSGRIRTLRTDASGLLDPQAQRLLDAFAALEPQPCEILEPEQARRQPTLADAVRRVLTEDGRSAEPEPVGEVRDITALGPVGEIRMRVYRPAGGPEGPLPGLVWAHGGGWVLSDVDTYDASCRGLANRSGAVVVSPEYRRAPEHVFPAAYDDMVFTYRWITSHADELGVDPARVAVGGEGVGATMAAATCWALAQVGEPLPVAQVLVHPLTTAREFGVSVADAADARPLDRPLVSWLLMHAFAGVPEAVVDQRVELLSVPLQELALLPPALILTAERDPLRSQGEEFALRLERAGVPTTLTRYAGVPHDFFGAAAVLDQAARAQQQAADHLRAAFGTS